MGARTVALTCASVLSVARLVSAQAPAAADSLTAMQTAVACSPPPVLATEPGDALRVVGSQDVVNRDLYGTPEVLVLSAGADRDVKVNDMYYVRRVFRTAETRNDRLAHPVQTIGWVRVVAVNERMALVSPEHTCSEIRNGDYLEPFAPPPVMEDAAAMPPIIQGELDFAAYSRVVYGNLERRSIGTNDFAVLDHGVDHNIRIGARMAIYRDLQLAKNPLKRIGEAVVVSVGPSMSVVRVTSARDAIFSGDVMIPRAADIR